MKADKPEVNILRGLIYDILVNTERLTDQGEEIEKLVKSQLQERDNAFQEKLNGIKDCINEWVELISTGEGVTKEGEIYYKGQKNGYKKVLEILDKHINLTPKQE
jgi:hypothetical protein